MPLMWINFSVIFCSISVIIFGRWLRNISKRMNQLELVVMLINSRSNQQLFDYTEEGLKNELHNEVIGN